MFLEKENHEMKLSDSATLRTYYSHWQLSWSDKGTDKQGHLNILRHLLLVILKQFKVLNKINF